MFDRFTKLAATSAIAIAVAGGASAQGLGSYAGPYVGLSFGYGAVDLEVETNIAGNDLKESMTGFDLAGFVGYEVREDRTYYSIEAELNLPFKQNDIGNNNQNVDEYTKEMGYAVNARAGYFLTDGTMVYGLVGIEAAEFTAEIGNNENSENVLGLRLGGGTEIRATNAWSVRAEYIYTIYEDFSLGQNGATIDASDSTFRVGGVYRFQL